MDRRILQPGISSLFLVTLSLMTALGMSMPGHASTAEEGQPGDSSLVTIELSLNVLPTIQISNVADIRLAITDRSVDASFKEDLCIKGNTGDSYTLMASGSGSKGSQYALHNTEGEDLHFQVLYKAGESGTEHRMKPGEPSPYFSLPSLQDNCISGLSSLSVLFTSEELRRVSPGMYTGELTLVVSPI